MKGQEVVLTDMLACRERRVNIQNEYIQRYHCPVISFCMNIPGPIKTNEQIKKAFLSGKEALFAVLQKENIPVPDSRRSNICGRRRGRVFLRLFQSHPYQKDVRRDGFLRVLLLVF